ncbi:hypothetical protein VDGE_04939 [Verticillium dahliae]|uniref:5'-3' DNA helicase ZGRF1-like N-terminal domain-containing protein n=1 Tax=Verticillium dahliae TaxID=27337 RepID=A0A444RUF9_VERDA|nr:hypothetical protein VDGE_04939 [Verticillium dahliae]
MNVINSSQSNSETGTATAAPVLDYACLFSHDLKRKQKRWQDGRLKFHCFNKRVMVYDERGNFIGDTHWTMDYDLDEGEEFQLARGCVVVQVSECLGRKEQDLSALIDQRYKDKEERKAHADAAAASKPYRPAPTPHRPPMPIAQPMTNIATPRGNQLGRAVLPTLSPFEQRNLHAQESAQQDEQVRPAKRRRPEASPPSKSGAILPIVPERQQLSLAYSKARKLEPEGKKLKKRDTTKNNSGRRRYGKNGKKKNVDDSCGRRRLKRKLRESRGRWRCVRKRHARKQLDKRDDRRRWLWKKRSADRKHVRRRLGKRSCVDDKFASRKPARRKLARRKCNVEKLAKTRLGEKHCANSRSSNKKLVKSKLVKKSCGVRKPVRGKLEKPRGVVWKPTSKSYASERQEKKSYSKS